MLGKKCMHGRQNNGPQRCAATLHDIRDFADVIKSRVLRSEIILDYLGEPDVIIGVLINERKKVGQSKAKKQM